MKYDYIVGIDPDVDKNGVCLLNVKRRTITIQNLSLVSLLDYLKEIQTESQKESFTYIVVVEAGWLNRKSCFHYAVGKGVQRIAKNVGANHQAGKQIIELCRHYGINVTEQKPYVKCWGGRDKKITHKELLYFIDTLPKTTNQESRDATLLAWNYANLPIKKQNHE